MHLLHCSLCFYSSSSSSFLPLLLSFLPLLFSFLPKLLPSLFFFSCFPLPSFLSSPHFVFLLCPFFAPFSCFSPLLVFFHLFPSRFPFFLPFSSSRAFSSTSLFSLNCFHPFSSSPVFHFPLSCHLLILSFFFVPIFFPLFFSPYHTPFFFFLRELLILNAFQDVTEDTTDCNRMQFN